PLEVTVDTRALGDESRGTATRSAVPAFMTAQRAKVYRVTSEDGYEIKATAWHDFYTERGKLPLEQLQVGDGLWVESGKGQFGSEGNADLGELLGLVTGDGHFTNRGKGKQAVVVNLWGDDRALGERVAAYMNVLLAQANLNTTRSYTIRPVAV